MLISDFRSTAKALSRSGLAAGLLTFLSFAALGLTACGPKELPPEVQRLLQTTVNVETDALPASIREEKERVRAWKETQTFYQKRNFQLAWVDANGPLPRAQELVDTISKLGNDGLDVRRYSQDRLAAEVKAVDALKSYEDPESQQRLVDLDVELTYTFLTLASHVASGRLQPSTLRIDWYTKPRNVDLDARLEQALGKQGEGEIEKALHSLAPPSEDYARLREALARYRAQAAQGGWPQVPAGPDLKKGDQGVRVQALAARLTAGGDLQTQQGAAAPAVFDDTLAAAVSRFQARHGLDPTGTVDADTLEALNVPLGTRIAQMVANLERWRWMPNDLGERYILVNLPEYRMELVENGKPAVSMRVVIGKTQSRTPVFSDQMTYLELNPMWNLPSTIAGEEVVPKLASDPSYLARNDMEVVKGWSDDAEPVDLGSLPDLAVLADSGSGYRLRQRPGAQNPLGKVKFMFPNEWDIYLHDTPADHLFSREERDFSHGCIRLEKPIALAEYLLKDDPEWSPRALQEALASGERKTVKLPKPLPVHLVYWTAWVEPNGTVQFRKDVYGHDTALVKALEEEPPVWLDLNAVRGSVRAAK
ncbi:MAG TPA: L,D-transpeptidase family protein [Thermoanaerobaculia bacterium]|nr:L,D-transpeptidase family protein [Thermoanaerobaculia bacterium]